MPHFLTALFITVAFAGLGGCGQTGPLYMPPAPETAPASVPEPQPAAPADSAAQPTKGP